MRRTQAESEETRQALVASARHCFAELGFTKTSMDDLTGKAGLTRGALYHHFGDKKGLLTAVVATLDEEMDQRLQSAESQFESIWKGFCFRCETYLRIAQETEYQQIVIRDARGVLGGDGRDQAKCIATMQQKLAQMMDAGVIKKADAEALALVIFGGIEEAAVWVAEDRNDARRLERSLATVQLLLQGLLV